MKIALIGVCAGLAMTSACAVTRPPARPAGLPAASVQSQIAAATARWNAALVSKDYPALQALLAPDFVLSTEGHFKVPRDQWLKNLEAMTIARIDVRHVAVRTEGNVAVAQMEGEWDVTRNGKRALIPFKGEDSWVFRDGRWQVFRRKMAN